MTPSVQQLPGQAMQVNSYLVDAGPGIVVVDAQLCVGDAIAVRAAVRDTGKPLLAVLVTHPHPDHYAGGAIIADGAAVPIVATETVAAVIARDDEEKNRVVGPMMGDQWPMSRRFPDHTVADGATLVFGDLTFSVRSWGPGESHEDTVWVVDEETWFVGDLVYNGHHAYLADGHGLDWLQTLTRLEHRLTPATTLYAGHGNPGGRELLAVQRGYLETFLDAVDRASDLDPDERRGSVVDAIRPLVPSDELLFLAQLSIEPTWSARQAGNSGAATGQT